MPVFSLSLNRFFAAYKYFIYRSFVKSRSTVQWSEAWFNWGQPTETSSQTRPIPIHDDWRTHEKMGKKFVISSRGGKWVFLSLSTLHFPKLSRKSGINLWWKYAFALSLSGVCSFGETFERCMLVFFLSLSFSFPSLWKNQPRFCSIT